MLSLLLRLGILLFLLSEIGLALFKRGSRATRVDDRGSMRLLWFVIMSSIGLSVMFSGNEATALPFGATARRAVAVFLTWGGLGLRWWAIITLGRFFTTDVAVHAGHRVVTTGPYRFARHPSYTGLLTVFAGMGVFFGTWLSVLVMVVPITLAVLHRIRHEEAVLAGALGDEYAAYCARTKRLIPRVI